MVNSFVLFLYLKEKARKRSKQTCGLIACAALTELRTLLFMIFDMNIENLKAREGVLRWNPAEHAIYEEKDFGSFLTRAYKK